MRFEVKLVPSADDDLVFYKRRQQNVIVDAVEGFLGVDADIESRKRRRLRPNPLAPWELRIGDYRVFYEIRAQGLVRMLAIGHKVHSDLFIRGQRVEI